MSAGVLNWRAFFGRHWRAFAVIIVACAAAVVDAVLVFLWFAGSAQSSGSVPKTVGLWTMGNLVTFAVEVTLWELLLAGVPVVVGASLAYRWWKGLPVEERGAMELGKGSRSTGGGGGFGLLLFIAFCIKVYVDGKWNVAIGTFTVNYVVYSVVTILLWTLVIFGVPAAIALTWWLRKELRKGPSPGPDIYA